MNEQEPVNDVTPKTDVVKVPGGQSGMLATRLSTYVKPGGAIALLGVAGFMAVGIVETIAHVIGFALGAIVVCYGARAYSRRNNP